MMARSIFLLLSVMAFLLLLFFLFGGALEGWTADTLSSGAPPFALAVLIFVLLASDILLPVPASLLAVAAGAAFGVVLGVAIVAAGLSAGAIIGFSWRRASARPSVESCWARLSSSGSPRFWIATARYFWWSSDRFRSSRRRRYLLPERRVSVPSGRWRR